MSSRTVPIYNNTITWIHKNVSNIINHPPSPSTWQITPITPPGPIKFTATKGYKVAEALTILANVLALPIVFFLVAIRQSEPRAPYRGSSMRTAVVAIRDEEAEREVYRPWWEYTFKVGRHRASTYVRGA